MLSLYHAYQAYERRIMRGELSAAPPASRKETRKAHLSLAFRLGDLLVRAGMRLKHEAVTGHALTSTTMAER
jgi:hypothetical protein